MIKKIWIFLCFSLFVFVVPSLALEVQGQTITAQDIKNLPPGTIQSLPPGTMEKVNKAMSSEQNTLPAKEVLQKKPLQQKPKMPQINWQMNLNQRKLNPIKTNQTR
jgi:hypothetical protein